MLNCPDCQAFDAETKRLLTEVFSQDEIGLMISLIASFIKVQTLSAEKLSMMDMRKFKIKRDADFAVATVGKLLMGLDITLKEKLLAEVKKHYGMEFKITHENCPHGVKS